MGRIEAVLFDWSGTLVHYFDFSWLVRTALTELGRPVGDDVVGPLMDRLRGAWASPEVESAFETEDCSADQHRAANFLLYRRADVDDELADTMYRLLAEPSTQPLYPDAETTLRRVGERGARIALVSDIHFDLRERMAHDGLADLVDAYVLSFEHGFQKPDHRMFTLALDALDVSPGQALMVGDRHSRDGAAVEVGIASLILPRQAVFGRRGLDVVPRLVA